MRCRGGRAALAAAAVAVSLPLVFFLFARGESRGVDPLFLGKKKGVFDFEAIVHVSEKAKASKRARRRRTSLRQEKKEKENPTKKKRRKTKNFSHQVGEEQPRPVGRDQVQQGAEQEQAREAHGRPEPETGFCFVWILAE